jgi:hypothetical protein
MKIDTRELDSWVKNQPNRDRAKRQALTVMKNTLVDEVVKEVSEHSTTGKLANSVMGTATDRKIEIRSNLYGDIVLEYGRRPGKFPPVEPLERWALQHGMDRGMGYVIARNIARRGTKKYRQGGPKQISEIEDRFNRDIMPNRMYTLLNEYTK